jgi:TolA-binding protein
LAEKGEYREAFAAAESAGFEGLIQGASASDLLLLADTARLSGATEPARHALLALRERYPSHVNASRAGFLLGRLAFEQQHDVEAVRWLRDYLAQKPTGPLAEGARSRLLLALKRLGDRAAAKAAALDYLEHYPQGRTAEAARGILSE